MTRKIVVAAAVLGLIAVACAQESTPRSQPEPQPASPVEEPAGPEEISVVATEYAYDGIAETPEAGEVTFVLENEGEEPHELGLVRITGDQSVEELIQLPGNRANQFIEDVGHAFARPGKSDEAAVDLTAGRYGYACFVETKNGEPHALLGMYGEFEVA